MKALGISYTVEEGVLVVSIELESASYLLFQKGVEEATGKDESSYFEYGDQAYGGYGLVKLCMLSSGELLVVLDEPLNGVDELRVALGHQTPGLPCLAEQLPKVFANEAGYSNASAPNQAVKPFVALLLTRTLSTPHLLAHGFAIFARSTAPS